MMMMIKILKLMKMMMIMKMMQMMMMMMMMPLLPFFTSPPPPSEDSPRALPHNVGSRDLDRNGIYWTYCSFRRLLFRVKIISIRQAAP